MLSVLKLLIPALIPSWRFFDIIAPSPRIQFALLQSETTPVTEWREFRPRPAHVSFMQMLGHMFWNPVWNESLFLVSCAERIMEQPTRHSEDEILKRIKTEFVHSDADRSATHFQFRLLVVRREGEQMLREVVFESRLELLSSQEKG